MIETRYPEARVLQQIAGVGPLISLTFILTIGDPNRFKKSREIGQYLGWSRCNESLELPLREVAA